MYKQCCRGRNEDVKSSPVTVIFLVSIMGVANRRWPLAYQTQASFLRGVTLNYFMALRASTGYVTGADIICTLTSDD